MQIRQKKRKKNPGKKLNLCPLPLTLTATHGGDPGARTAGTPPHSLTITLYGFTDTAACLSFAIITPMLLFKNKDTF